MTNGEKIVRFYVAIMDMYKDEDEREANVFSPIPIPENGDITDDIYAMLTAMQVFYHNVTQDVDKDMIDFLAILTKITFMKCKLAEQAEQKEE